VVVAKSTLEMKDIPKRTIFGNLFVSRRTGEPEVEHQRLFHGTDVFLRIEDIPVFYLPFVQGDANDPLGPLQDVSFNYDRIFGFQLKTTFNMFDLIGVDPIPGTRWKLFADYLSERGPALGTEYDFAGKELFGTPARYVGLVKAYGIYDDGKDILGGGRGELDKHPLERGRFLFRDNVLELPYGFSVQSQVSALSDHNFLEQYYKLEYDQDINQETFVNVKQQRDTWAWTALVEPRIRNWVTETEWLPRLDGYVLGESLFDPRLSPFGEDAASFLDNRFTYNAHASAGYARLETVHTVPFPPPPPVPFEVTDQNVSTGRFDLMQELSLPFYLGPVKMVPYGVLDLAYYTQDLTGSDEGRIYYGGGLRASMPLTRLYPDVQSDFMNLNGINHKIVPSLNYYVAHSDTPFSRLPQLDRLNDDSADQALRDIHPILPLINPAHGTFLQTSPLFDPQVYAIRRLVDDRIDTLDTIQVVQADIRGRFQTKRGYPGQQHIVDWMTLDVSGSFFPDDSRGSLWPYPTQPPRSPFAVPNVPNAQRDNFGESFAFLEYDYTWNIGDRTALVSTGWYDPIDNGARVFTIGAYFNRPDRTSYYIGFRDLQPVGSQAVTAAMTYIFSPKYAMTASTTYDFGTNQSVSNSLLLSRMGSDLQLNLGITYNAILSTFGVAVEIIPNLASNVHRVAGLSPFGSKIGP
jgi:hypothetical protein